MPFDNGFASLQWSEDGDADAATIWSVLAHDTTYFGSGDQMSMINFRVDDIDALLERLAASGIEIVPERTDGEFGKFAWIVDLEGNRVELWQPVRRLP